MPHANKVVAVHKIKQQWFLLQFYYTERYVYPSMASRTILSRTLMLVIIIIHNNDAEKTRLAS